MRLGKSAFFSLTSAFSAAALAAAGLFCGCSGGGGGGGESDHEFIRIVHANPEFGAIDFDITDEARFNEVAYGNETGYFDVHEGTIKVAVKSETQVLPIVQKDVTVAADKDYSIFFLAVANAPDLVTIEDDSSAPEDGQFRIRAGNFAASRGSVDIYIVRPGDSIKDQAPLATAVTYQSFAEYKGIDAGEYQLKYTNTGSTKVIRSTDTLEFQSGGVYSHFLIDSENGSSPQSRLLVDALF